MSLFAYLLRIVFLEREDVFLKTCYSFQESKTKAAHLRARVSRPGRGHIQRQGRGGFVGGGGPGCCLRMLPASALSRLLSLGTGQCLGPQEVTRR